MAKKKQNDKGRSKKYQSELNKLKKLYENYGIDTSDMGDDEFERIYRSYHSKEKSIESDVKESERYSEIFKEDIIG